MSDTNKNPTDPTKRPQPGPTAAGQGNQGTSSQGGTTQTSAAREARGTAREAMDRAENVGHRAVDESREIGEAVTETMVRSADAAAGLGQRVADQSREVMLLGVRAAAGMGGRLSDENYGRSHRLLGATARALDIYREAGENSADHVHALFDSGMTLARGMQQIQHAWVDMLDRAMDRAAHKPQDLLRAKSIEQFAEVQRDLYLDTLNYAFESSSTLLQIAGRVAQDAMRPLQGRAGNGALRS